MKNSSSGQQWTCFFVVTGMLSRVRLALKTARLRPRTTGEKADLYFTAGQRALQDCQSPIRWPALIATRF
jgi:hypothetical protein